MQRSGLQSENGQMVAHQRTYHNVNHNDPACSKWCVSRHTLKVWIDMSSLAIGISLEPLGGVIKDPLTVFSKECAAHQLDSLVSC